jgi:plastocyanin
MRWYPRLFIALAVLASGLALTPGVALPMERFGWQQFADAYQPTPVQVSIENLAFKPATIIIPVGTSVRWTNNDQVQHTVTDTMGGFDSGVLEPGQSFERSFDVPGTYSYVCTIHPSMQGTVIVAEQVFEYRFPIIMKDWSAEAPDQR